MAVSLELISPTCNHTRVTSQEVYALAAANGILYVGGTFDKVNLNSGGTQTLTVGRIAKWDGSAWSTMNGGVSGGTTVVNAIAVRGNRVYAGGNFTSPAAYVAYYENSTWSALSGTGGPTVIVNAIAVAANGDVYVGGNVGFLKKWSNNTWSDLGSGVNGDVNALAIRGNDLYVGGGFSTAGGLSANNIAKWSLVGSGGWSSLPGELWGTQQRILSIAFNGSGQLYVAGTAGKKIYAYVNGAWSTTIPAGDGLSQSQFSATGRALAVDRSAGKVYVGGYFDSISTTPSTPANYVAVWNDMEYYTLSDIGVLNGGTYSYGLGVNNSWAVGYGEVNVTGYGLRNHAYYYQGGYYINDMGGIWGAADNSYANAINDGGTIVGYSDYFGSGTLIRAFKWTSGGGFTQLNPFTGGDRGNAQSINNNGDIVGFSRNNSSVDRATRWSTTAVDDLRSLILADLGSYASYAYGINKDGYIVGKARYNSGNPYFHAYRCAPNGRINDVNATDLGTLGGNESIAYAINDSRQIVGASLNSSGFWRAFLKAPDSGTGTGFTDLGSGYAYGINNYGDVVGSGSWAFIWTSASGLVNLNNVIPAGSGWSTLSSAEAINDSGVIVGWGYKIVGQGYQIHGFRLTP
jgi:probable HAF family extracellular repeat protein